MAQIKLFDTWTYAKEIPEPFSRFMKELKIRKTTLKQDGFHSTTMGNRLLCTQLLCMRYWRSQKYICGNLPEQSEFKEGIMVF